jgi:hypothetical protein
MFKHVVVRRAGAGSGQAGPAHWIIEIRVTIFGIPKNVNQIKDNDISRQKL